MKPDLIFLRGPFKLRNDTTFSLGKELGFDQFMFRITFIIATEDVESMKNLCEHVKDCMYKAKNLLSTIQSVREMFYDSVRQWCEVHMTEPVVAFGELNGTNGVRLVNALQFLSNKVAVSSENMKRYFSGREIAPQPPNGHFAKEAIKMARAMTATGILEDKLFSILFEKAGDMQLGEF